MPALDYTYGPTGLARLEYTCGHGSTLLRDAELYYTPDPFVATIVRHRSRFGCLCDPSRFVRRWPDARLALAHYEAMAADVPLELDSLDLDVTLRDLVDLRANVPCDGCVLAWTATAEAGGQLSRQYTHADDCPEHAKRKRAGKLRSTHSTFTRKAGAVS